MLKNASRLAISRKTLTKTLYPAILALFTLFLAIPVIAGEAGYSILSHDIEVSVDIKKRSMDGADTLVVKKEALDASPEIPLYLRKGTEVRRVEVDGAEARFSTARLAEEDLLRLVVQVPEKSATKEELRLKVAYRMTFPPIESARENLVRGISFLNDGVIGDEGAFLPASSRWYPQMTGDLTDFRLSVKLPPSYRSVSEGEMLRAPAKGGRPPELWKTEHPIDGLDLVAGRYIVEKEAHKGVDVYTFFYKKDKNLSRLYLDKSKEYLDFYSSLIGPYPYKKFAVVENFLPTGFGMPSFTLLGSTVIRLPFIPDTSLGHEIAHNWWGNSVFRDESSGNWTEALATYTADYLYSKKGGKDAEFRLQKLRGYRSYAGNSTLSLSEFGDSIDPADRSVGYNKGLFVFKMLSDVLGEEAFGAGLKEFYSTNAFRRASWADIKAAFEKASGKNLKSFFDEWVERGGGPMLSISDVALKKDGTVNTVSFKLSQTSPLYTLKLPYVIKTAGAEVKGAVELRKESETFTVNTPDTPLSIEIDPAYEVFRLLSGEEVPASFNTVFGNKDSVVVFPSSDPARSKYSDSAELLSSDYELAVMLDNVFTADYLKVMSVFVFGGPDETAAFGIIKEPISKALAITDAGFSVGGKNYGKDASIAICATNPASPSRVVCSFIAGTGLEAGEVLEKTKRMRFSSEESYVVFLKDGGVEKGIFPGKNLLFHEFAPAGPSGVK